MIFLTLTISLAAAVLVFLLKPKYLILVYISVMALYPSYLTIPMGTIDFTARRIVMMFIILRFLARPDWVRKFRMNGVDKWLLIYFFSECFAGFLTASSLSMLIENRAGKFLDLILPYFLFRLTVFHETQYVKILKGILVISFPLSVLAFVQSLTGINPMGFLKNYYAWQLMLGVPLEQIYERRFGFVRADVVFEHPIMLGLYFAVFGVLCAGILLQKNRRQYLWTAALIFMGIGVFSSMSSGPMLAAVTAGAFLIFFRWRKYWKPVLWIVLCCCIVVEVLTPLHIYDVVGRYVLNPETAWYRSRLISVALGEGGMKGHWLMGYGINVDPGWGPLIDGRGHTDLVNHSIYILCQFGMLGLIPFFIMNAAVVKELVTAGKVCKSRENLWLVWCSGASLFGLACASMATAFVGPPATCYYILLGTCGTLYSIMYREYSYSRVSMVRQRGGTVSKEIMISNCPC